jgi:8-oxo-dGTP diphosphatase
LRKEHHRAYLACYWVLIEKDSIMLLRRVNTGFEDGNYSMIAGHLDGDETVKQALKREVKEESSVDLDVNDMEILHTMHRNAPDREYIDFFISASKWKGEIKNMEPEKCDDLNWFKLNDLPKNTIPYIKFAIEKIIDKEPYSEYGFKN